MEVNSLSGYMGKTVLYIQFIFQLTLRNFWHAIEQDYTLLLLLFFFPSKNVSGEQNEAGVGSLVLPASCLQTAEQLFTRNQASNYPEENNPGFPPPPLSRVPGKQVLAIGLPVLLPG